MFSRRQVNITFFRLLSSYVSSECRRSWHSTVSNILMWLREIANNSSPLVLIFKCPFFQISLQDVVNHVSKYLLKCFTENANMILHIFSTVFISEMPCFHGNDNIVFYVAFSTVWFHSSSPLRTVATQRYRSQYTLLFIP